LLNLQSASAIKNMLLLNRFDNQKTACYHCVTAWDKTSHCRVQTQGMLFDIMPVHNREIDGLEYLLRDALWSSQNSAPDVARVFAALCTLIVAEQMASAP
jgi:hypothetical protein